MTSSVIKIRIRAEICRYILDGINLLLHKRILLIKLCDTLLTKMVIGNTVILYIKQLKRKEIGKICVLNTLFITRFRLWCTVLHRYIYDNIVSYKKLPIIFKGNLKKTVSKSKSIKERKVTYVLMIPHYSLKYPWLYLVMLADMPYNYIFMADIFLYTPHRKQIICYIVSNKPLIYYRF